MYICACVCSLAASSGLSASQNAHVMWATLGSVGHLGSLHLNLQHTISLIIFLCLYVIILILLSQWVPYNIYIYSSKTMPTIFSIERFILLSISMHQKSSLWNQKYVFQFQFMVAHFPCRICPWLSLSAILGFRFAASAVGGAGATCVCSSVGDHFCMYSFSFTKFGCVHLPLENFNSVSFRRRLQQVRFSECALT